MTEVCAKLTELKAEMQNISKKFNISQKEILVSVFAREMSILTLSGIIMKISRIGSMN